MLVEFSVENLLSFKDRVTFSMLASSDDSSPNNRFFCNALQGDSKKLLKSTAIYGANASGKSNLLKSINFIKYLVMESHRNQEGDKINVRKFKLDQNCETKPSSLEIIFIYENIKYCYGVKLDIEKIHEEYLYYWPKGRRVTLFERWDTNQFELHKDTKSKEEAIKQKIYLETTLDNILFLSQATKLKHPQITKAFKWFKDELFITGDYEIKGLKGVTTRQILETPNFKEKVLKYLEFADISIKDLEIEQINKKAPEIIKKHILKDLQLKLGGEIQESNIEFIDLKISTIRTGKDLSGNTIPVLFNIKEESSGTQRYLNLIGPIIDILENGHCVFFIDELDASLHPNILKALVKIIHNPEFNKNNAQFVFTTHCTSLLTQELFRRDQIWFTDKNYETGATNLISLDDYSVRKDLNIEKAYLEGRFGAIPFLNEGLLLCQQENRA